MICMQTSSVSVCCSPVPSTMVASEARADSAPRFQIGAITRAAWAMGRLQRLRLWRVGRLAKRWESQVDVGKKLPILNPAWNMSSNSTRFNKIQRDLKSHHVPPYSTWLVRMCDPQPSIPHCDEVLRCRWRKGMANASDILGE